jgi:hypothetical protein
VDNGDAGETMDTEEKEAIAPIILFSLIVRYSLDLRQYAQAG